MPVKMPVKWYGKLPVQLCCKLKMKTHLGCFAVFCWMLFICPQAVKSVCIFVIFHNLNSNALSECSYNSLGSCSFDAR